MKEIQDMSQIELAAFVQTHLAKKGVEVVLSGGAAVSFYVGAKYVSKDIDLVADWAPKTVALNKAMAELGFMKEAKYYRHPRTEEHIEILPGPLSVGEQTNLEPIEIQLSTGILKILSPTDCVKDRLAAFFHWGDTQSLKQAIWVTKAHKVNIENIRRWAKKENKVEEFQEYLNETGKTN